MFGIIELKGIRYPNRQITNTYTQRLPPKNRSSGKCVLHAMPLKNLNTVMTVSKDKKDKPCGLSSKSW